EAPALYGGVRFNSDVPYSSPVPFAPASMRYASDVGDPLGGGNTDSFVWTDGKTSTAGSTRHAVHLELQSPGGTPIWVMDFAAPNLDPIGLGPYGTSPYPQVTGLPSLNVSNGPNSCASNTASFYVYEISWSDTNALQRFAADITVTCTG